MFMKLKYFLKDLFIAVLILSIPYMEGYYQAWAIAQILLGIIVLSLARLYGKRN